MGNAGTLYLDLDVNQQAALAKVFAGLQQLATKGGAVMDQMGKKVTKGLTKPLKDTHIAASKTYGYLKDIGRIVQGILISQILYRGILQPLQEAVRELWNFNMQLERTEIMFKYLLKDVNDLMADTSKLASDLMYTLEVIAARTPYTMKTVTDATTTLLALGFKREQLTPLLTLMADLSAATGGEADQMERLAYAMGKIQQRGRMTMREMRLFIRARVPIMDILKEQLGITELPTKMAIPANVILPAIIKGIMKFRGAAEEMEQSLSGLLSSLHDYFLFIARDIFQGFFDWIKEHLSNLREQLAELWSVFKKFGMEGLLLSVFPRELADSLWQLINVIQETGKNLAFMLKATAEFRQELFRIALGITNFVAKSFLILTTLFRRVSQTAAQAQGVLKVLAAAIMGLMVSSTVAMALAALVKMFSKLFVFAGGVYRIIGLVIGALVALTALIPGVQKFFTGLGTRILRLFGIQIPQSISITKAALAGISAEEVGEIDWQQLIDAFGDVEEGAEDAANAVNKKFLASFDEVYAIPEKTANLDLADTLADLSDMDFGMPEDAFEDILGDVGAALEGVGLNFQDLWEIVKKVGKGIWDSLIVIFDRIKQTLPSLGEAIFETIYKVFYFFPSAIAETMAFLTPKIANVMLLVIKAIFDAISAYGLDRLATIAIILAGMLLKIGVSWAKIGNSIGMMIAEAIVMGLEPMLNNLLAKIGLSAGRSILVSLLEPLQHLGFGRIEAIDNIIKDYDKWSQSELEEIRKANEKKSEYVIENSLVYEEAQKTIEESLGDIVDTTKDMTDLIFSESEDFYDKTSPIFEQLGKDINSEIEDIPSGIIGIWDPVLEEVTAPLKNWWLEQGSPILEDIKVEIPKVFEEALSNTEETVGTGIEGVTDNIASTLDKAQIDVGEAAFRFGRKMGENITGEVDSALNTFDDESEDKAIVGGGWWSTQMGETEVTLLGALESWSIFDGNWWVDKFRSPMVIIAGFLNNIISMIESTINNISRMVSGINLQIPSWLGGGSFSVNLPTVNLPRIQVPEAAGGAIVGRDQLVRVGEGNKTEGVFPLNEQTLKPFAEMIGSFMNSNQGAETDSDYVLVRANKQDLTKMWRQMYTIKKREEMRGLV